MRVIHEIKTKEPLCEELIASHRDPSILNGTLITQMPDNEMEQESWKRERNKHKRNDMPWINIEDHKVSCNVKFIGCKMPAFLYSLCGTFR